MRQIYYTYYITPHLKSLSILHLVNLKKLYTQKLSGQFKHLSLTQVFLHCTYNTRLK